MFVVLLRHAERQSGGADPGLSAAGQERARQLAGMLAETGIEAVFTSEFKRTQETAAPLLSRLGFAAIQLDDIALAPQQVRAAGERVLVVGHSDTVPALIAALGGPTDVSIDDNTFNRLFVLQVNGSAADLLSMTYGASS